MAFPDGHYAPYDLNQPVRIARRRGGHQDFNHDTSITGRRNWAGLINAIAEMGAIHAQMVGRCLRTAGNVPLVVYSSPALRCIQTAAGVIRGASGDARIRIEPALFEWMGWVKSDDVAWMTVSCRSQPTVVCSPTS